MGGWHLTTAVSKNISSIEHKLQAMLPYRFVMITAT